MESLDFWGKMTQFLNDIHLKRSSSSGFEGHNWATCTLWAIFFSFDVLFVKFLQFKGGS